MIVTVQANIWLNLGNNYELGLKSDWMNSRLTTTLAIFRIEQDNVAQSTGTPIPGSNGETAYKAVDGTVSKGWNLNSTAQLPTTGS